MKKVLAILFFCVMATVQAQNVYLEVDRNQESVYNGFQNTYEQKWDLPTERQVRKDLQEKMNKEGVSIKLTRNEDDADFILTIDGEGWVLERAESYDVYDEKEAAIRWNNTVKDIVLTLKYLQ